MGKQIRGGRKVWVIRRTYLSVHRYWVGTVKDHDHRGWRTNPEEAIHFDNPMQPKRVIRIHLESIGDVVPVRIWSTHGKEA